MEKVLACQGMELRHIKSKTTDILDDDIKDKIQQESIDKRV